MSDSQVYSLDDLATRLGKATEDEARLQFEGISDADLVAKGADIGTPRLVKELARNYGVFADWLPKADKSQEEALGFIGLDWLRVAVWSGRRAEVLNEQRKHGASGGDAGKQVHVARAAELEAKARAAVGRLRTSLRQLSGGLVTWVARIDAADATAVSVSPTADALAALADVADAMLKDKSPGMVARRKNSKLTHAAMDEHRKLAGELREAAKNAAAVKAAPSVTQSDVDLWDGIAITFFEQFVEMVEAARETDPRIPAPSIIGLRNWFGRARRSAKDDKEPAAAPQGSGDK